MQIKDIHSGMILKTNKETVMVIGKTNSELCLMKIKGNKPQKSELDIFYKRLVFADYYVVSVYYMIYSDGTIGKEEIQRMIIKAKLLNKLDNNLNIEVF